MSLIKQAKTTDKGVAARRSNGRRSRGASTSQGKERIRAANLKHGYYSQIREEALAALGEDPRELTALIAGAYEQWEPASGEQCSMVEEMARLRWRIRRSERMQESFASGYVAGVVARRRAEMEAECDGVEDAINLLECLEAHALRPDFHAPPGLLRQCAEIYKGKRGGEMLQELLLRLRKPQQEIAVTGCLPEEATCDDDWQHLLATQGDGDYPHRHPQVPVAEGEERDELRQELRAVAGEEKQQFEETLNRLTASAGKPFTTSLRDQLAADVNHRIDLMRRQEDSCYRNFFRLANLLIKIQDRKEKRECEARGQETEAGSCETEGGGGESRKRKAEGESQASGAMSRKSEVVSSISEAPKRDEVPTPNSKLRTSNAVVPTTDSELGTYDTALPSFGSRLLTPSRKNEGDSGDLDENTGRGKGLFGVRPPLPGPTAPNRDNLPACLVETGG